MVRLRPATFAAGLALVVVGAATKWDGSVGESSPGAGGPPSDPALGPYLLFGVAHVVVAVGMLLTVRTRRPLSRSAWGVWGFVLLAVAASGPLSARWIAQGMEALTGLTDQNGPVWSNWPLTCLVLAALLSQVVGREADRPAMTVAGLTAVFTLVLWAWGFSLRGLSAGSYAWVVPALAGLAVLVVALRGRRAEQPDRSTGSRGHLGPPRPRIAIGVALLTAGATMTAAQLARWHTCLGWHWNAGEDTCGTIQSDSYDYILPSLSTQVPGAAPLHGIGLLALAVALALAMVAAPKRGRGTPMGPRWAHALKVGMVILGSVVSVIVALGGVVTLIPLYVVGDNTVLMVIWSLVDPVMFAVMACLIAANRRVNDEGGQLSDWWNAGLIRLFAGLALTNGLVEFLFWTGVYASYDTPPFTGQLRALVLLVIGLRLVLAREERAAPMARRLPA